MNILIKFFYIFSIMFVTNNAFANIIITNFNEDIKLTDFGREVKVKIKAKVELNSHREYYKWWSYIFNKNLRVEVSEAKVIGRQYKTTFGNNQIKFEFDNAFTGDILEFEFKYIQFDNNIDAEYIRQEYVSIPAFAKGANGIINLEIPYNLLVYSTNSNFINFSNSYTWKGKIPNGGFSELFLLTLKQAIWKVEIFNKIIGKEKISKIDIKIPLYFKNGNNIVEDYKITTNYDTNFFTIKEIEDDIEINFRNINGTTAEINVGATLKNDFDNKVWIKLDSSKFLKIDEKLSIELYDIIYNLQLNNKNNEPLYIILAKWVHNNIKYDINYLKSEMDSLKIISVGKGVCSHYAKLYNELLRTVGIPSVIVSGVSYDINEKKFEDHAWNLVYINGEWISIDATWGLYSGKLPVSHIFFYFGDRPIINYTVYGVSIQDFKSNMKKNIEFIK